MFRAFGCPGVLTPLLSLAISLAQLAPQTQQPSKIISSGSLAGRQLFGSACAGCHGLDGRGGEHGPNIASNTNTLRRADADLTHILREGIPAEGMPGFSSLLDNSQIEALIQYLRVLQGKGEAAAIEGNPEQGRLLFFGRARCSECHMVNGQGGFIGIDLSGYGRTHSPAVIRQFIVDPNKDPDPRRGAVVVVTREGQKYTGVIRNEDNFSLEIQALDGSFHLLKKAGLARIEHQGQSLMPSQYGSQLTKAELNDLAAYLSLEKF